MSVASSLSTIEIKEPFWGGETTNICEVEPCTPPRIERKTLLDPMSIRNVGDFLVAWSDRVHVNRMTVLNAEIGNLLYDILDCGHKEVVLNNLMAKIATARNASELSVPLWSYNTVEYDSDLEGTSWADKPYGEFDTMHEFIRDAGYETYISASNIRVHQVILNTAALSRLASAFDDEYFIIKTTKTLQGTINHARVYTVKLILEFWPGGVPQWRKY